MRLQITSLFHHYQTLNTNSFFPEEALNKDFDTFNARFMWIKEGVSVYLFDISISIKYT